MFYLNPLNEMNIDQMTLEGLSIRTSHEVLSPFYRNAILAYYRTQFTEFSECSDAEIIDIYYNEDGDRAALEDDILLFAEVTANVNIGKPMDV